MRHEFENSSCVNSAEYTPNYGLVIGFHNGYRYLYPTVEESQYRELVSRDTDGSPGGFFNAIIWGKPCSQLANQA